MKICTQVLNRSEFLQRPDLGRKLAAESRQVLQNIYCDVSCQQQVVIVVADGLSANAINQYAVNMVSQLLIDFAKERLACCAICLVEQGRVASGDEIAQYLDATHLVMLIGERPGLSAADSLGIYYTYDAHVGCSDG